MKIGIDANHLSVPHFTGAKNYSENLIKSLAKIDKINEYVVFVSKKVNIPNQKNFKLIITPRLLPFSKRQFFLSNFVKKEKVDVFHYLVPYGDILLNHPRVITTVHDVDLDFTYPLFSRYFFNRVICEITRRSVFLKTKIFITPTVFVKKELNHYFKVRNKKCQIVSIHEGVSGEFKQSTRNKNLKNHFLCMSDFAERKNIHRILEAYSILPQKMKNEVPLVIITSTRDMAGKFGGFVKRFKILSSVRIFINPSRSNLIKLYNQALCFVYPSFYEGFGLPLVEAMACGCPVITSNCGAMKEVVGSSALLVEPKSTIQISKAMEHIWLRPNIRNSLKSKGLSRAKEFNWEATARKTLNTYSQCLNMKVDEMDFN